MKQLFFSALTLFVLVGFSQAQEITFEQYKAGDFKNAQTATEKEGANLSQTGKVPLIWNYGTIKKGSTAIRYFKFTNTGNSPLIIVDAKGSCGCLIPSPPREPIMPGETAYIKIYYDTQRFGHFTKYATLTTNAKNGGGTVRLEVQGNVEYDAPSEVPASGKSIF